MSSEFGRRAASSLAANRGVTLVEVLVAVIVLSIGLLGIAGLQARALKYGQSSYERSVAVIQAHSIVDAMRANRDAAQGGAYNTGADAKCDATASSTSRAHKDLAAWVGQLQASMSGAANDVCGSINCSGTGVCTVGIQWDDTRGSPDASAGQQIERFTIETQL